MIPSDEKMGILARMLAVAIVLWLSVGATRVCGADNTAGYLQVTGPCGLTFPRDHAPHPGFRTEWWYYTGNLRTGTGRPIGFQLTFFRHQLAPSGARADWPHPHAAWRTDQLYLAHAAVSDISGKRHLQAGKASREALGMAGWEQEGSDLRIFVNDWQAVLGPDGHRLEASCEAFSFRLALTPVKAPVRHGIDGYSRKGATPERASCYYSLTRLETTGTVTIAGEPPVAVDGLSWMDHEFSTAPLAPGTIGWDWFSLQLSDGSDVMIFLLRREDGSIDPASGGTFVDALGAPQPIGFGGFEVEVRDTWRSQRSGARYPSRWRVKIPSARIDVVVTANLPDQEMHLDDLTGITYWEGSVSVDGGKAGSPVKGLGYVELTGYAAAFEALK